MTTLSPCLVAQNQISLFSRNIPKLTKVFRADIFFVSINTNRYSYPGTIVQNIIAVSKVVKKQWGALIAARLARSNTNRDGLPVVNVDE